MKNFHTHTYRCMHASGTDEDYVLAAIEAFAIYLTYSSRSAAMGLNVFLSNGIVSPLVFVLSF